MEMGALVVVLVDGAYGACGDNIPTIDMVEKDPKIANGVKLWLRWNQSSGCNDIDRLFLYIITDN